MNRKQLMTSLAVLTAFSFGLSLSAQEASPTESEKATPPAEAKEAQVKEQQPAAESKEAGSAADTATAEPDKEYVQPYETPAHVKERIERIKTAKEKTPTLFDEVAPMLVPYDDDPLWDYVPDAHRKMKPHLMRTPSVELLHPIYQEAVQNHPQIFEEFKQAAQECRDRVAAIDPPDRTKVGPIHKEYLDKLDQLTTKYNLSFQEKRLLRDASWFRNGSIPAFNPAYVLAWEDALLQDDVTKYMKLWVVKILWNIDDPKSTAIMGEALRELTMTPTPYEEERRAADMLTYEIIDGMFERPRPDTLVELGETVLLPGTGDRKYTITLRIGKALSQSSSWLDLMTQVSSDPQYAKYVGALHDAVDVHLNTVDAALRSRSGR